MTSPQRPQIATVTSPAEDGSCSRWDSMAPPGGIDADRRGLERLSGGVSHIRVEPAAPEMALRSRDSTCGRAVPRGVPPACRAIVRDPTCTACRGDGLGVRLRRRRTQAHDEVPPRRAVREGPIFAHGVLPRGNGASPPHRTWPSRSPYRRSSDQHPARSSTGVRCTDSAVTSVIARSEPGSTAVTLPRGCRGSTRMRRDSVFEPRNRLPARLCDGLRRLGWVTAVGHLLVGAAAARRGGH